jgi:hypothetical protein
MPGPVRNLLLSVDVKPAGKKCKCGRDQRHQIARGQARFVVKNAGGPGEKGYCATCGQNMIDAARQQLGQLEAALAARIAGKPPLSGAQGS